MTSSFGGARLTGSLGANLSFCCGAALSDILKMERINVYGVADAVQ
jgi:transketolase N-terminal domain/subunit